MLTLTIAAIRLHDACVMDARIADLQAHLGRPVGEHEEIPLRTWWDLATTSIADRWCAAHRAAHAAAHAAHRAAYAGEREAQRADLDRLLAELTGGAS